MIFDTPQFEVEFMSEAFSYLEELDLKTKEKVLENIRLSRFRRDSRLPKKLDKHILEFRTSYASKQVRLLAFWAKDRKSIMICTNGFLKKTQKTPAKYLRRAHLLREIYLNKIDRL